MNSEKKDEKKSKKKKRETNGERNGEKPKKSRFSKLMAFAKLYQRSGLVDINRPKFRLRFPDVYEKTRIMLEKEYNIYI